MRPVISVPAALLAAAALAVSLPACGVTGKSSSSKFSGVQGDVAKAIDDFQSDAKKGDGDKICDNLLASKIIKRLKAQKIDCADSLKKSVGEASTFDLTVKSVQVDGDRATAQVSDRAHGKPGVDTFTLVKEGGSWKILSLGS